MKTHVPQYERKPQHVALDSFLQIKPYTRGVISKFYGIIQNVNNTLSDPFKVAWGRELDREISNEMWENCIKNIHDSSINARHSLIQFKVVHRLHYSPSRLQKIFPDVSSQCIKCRSEEGTLSHLFLSCHKLQSFWGSLFDFFTKAFNHPCHPDPFTVLFGVANPDSVKSGCEAKAISLSTLLARKLILQSWKCERSPTFEMWLRELGNVLHLEKIRYIMSAKEEVFFKIWQPFLDLMSKN